MQNSHSSRELPSGIKLFGRYVSVQVMQLGFLQAAAGEGLAVQQCGVGVQVQHSDDKRHADVHTILCLLEVHGTGIIVQSHFNFVYTGQRMQYDQILFRCCIFLTVRI